MILNFIYLFLKLVVKIDDATSAIPIPYQFDLYGDGQIYFGATVGRDSNNFHGLYKDVGLILFLNKLLLIERYTMQPLNILYIAA